MLVAVYGTLKQGLENYDRYLKGQVPIHAAELSLCFRMFGNGEYPMLVPSEDAHPITLEVFDVTDDELLELDGLEAPYGYRRETVFLPGLERDVAIYVHPGPAPVGFHPIDSGNWRPAEPGC